MPGYVKTFWSVAAISFTGSLPPGITNMAAVQIAISKGVLAAFLFAIGSALAEAIYVRIALRAMSWLQKNEKLMRRMEVFSMVVLLILAFAAFKAAFSSVTAKILLSKAASLPLFLGLLLAPFRPNKQCFGLASLLLCMRMEN